MAERKETIKKNAPKAHAESSVSARSKSVGNSMTLSVRDLGLSDLKISSRSFALWIRALLQNWRQGTVSCKGRSDVARSRKKPWRQKGTGRARVGSARSPLWRGGGIIFGPQPRTRTLKVPSQMKQRVLAQLMYQLAQQGKINVLDFAGDLAKPKTSTAWQALKNAALTDNVMLLVEPGDVITQASFVNIPNVQVLFFDQLNAYHLADGNRVIVLQKNVERFKEMVARWT
jgi:large subunit ribosomal protein L4